MSTSKKLRLIFWGAFVGAVGFLQSFTPSLVDGWLAGIVLTTFTVLHVCAQVLAFQRMTAILGEPVDVDDKPVTDGRYR